MTTQAIADSRSSAALKINLALDRLLPVAQGPFKTVHAAMRYSVNAGGKRLRPLLALAACEAVGGDEHIAVSAACALECIHTYSLVHDDLPAMDNDDLRRGQPTCHVAFGEAIAILAGDGLLNLAFEILAEQYEDAELARDLAHNIHKAAGTRGMVGGQAADIEAECRSGPQTANSELSDPPTNNSPGSLLNTIHRHKTGALITASVLAGGRCGGVGIESGKVWDSLCTYGENVGLAFQIVDDILDVESTTEQMGKTVGKDADRNKLTYPAVHGIELSRTDAASAVAAAIEAANTLPRPARLVAIAEYITSRTH